MQPYIKVPIINQDSDRNVTQERIRGEAGVILNYKRHLFKYEVGKLSWIYNTFQP